MIKVGEFTTKCGILRITDPCYDKDVWCSGTVENCATGVWEAFVEIVDVDHWGNQVSKLIVKAKDEDAGIAGFVQLDIEVGVDSGQAGVFDNELYKTPMNTPVKLTGDIEYDCKIIEFQIKKTQDLLNGSERNAETESTYLLLDREIALLEARSTKDVASSTNFYDVCCDKTLSDTKAGTLEYGAVSSSGSGDGSYEAYAVKNKGGKVCEIMIDFGVRDDEEDDEDEEDEEE